MSFSALSLLPWGIFALLIIVLIVYFGKADGFLQSLSLGRLSFMILVLAFFLGSFFIPNFVINEVDFYLNIGGLLGFFLPALYFFFTLDRDGKWRFGAGFIWFFSMVFLYEEGFIWHLQRYLPIHNIFLIIIFIFIGALLTGRRKAFYSSSIIAIYIGQVWGIYRGLYGIWELGSLQINNQLIMMLLLGEIFLLLFSQIEKLKYLRQKKSPQGLWDKSAGNDLTNY